MSLYQHLKAPDKGINLTPTASLPGLQTQCTGRSQSERGRGPACSFAFRRVAAARTLHDAVPGLGTIAVVALLWPGWVITENHVLTPAPTEAICQNPIFLSLIR